MIGKNFPNINKLIKIFYLKTYNNCNKLIITYNNKIINNHQMYKKFKNNKQ